MMHKDRYTTRLTFAGGHDIYGTYVKTDLTTNIDNFIEALVEVEDHLDTYYTDLIDIEDFITDYFIKLIYDKYYDLIDDAYTLYTDSETFTSVKCEHAIDLIKELFLSYTVDVDIINNELVVDLTPDPKYVIELKKLQLDPLKEVIF